MFGHFPGAAGVVDVATLPYVRARAVGDAPNFGTSITTIPDWTGDGGSELALAGPTIDTSSAEDAGVVYVFSSDIF